MFLFCNICVGRGRGDGESRITHPDRTTTLENMKMHCAYLRTGDTWKFTDRPNDVLDHDGEVVICDTPEDQKEVKETLSQLDPDRIVNYVKGEYTVSDYPYYDIAPKDIKEQVRQYGKVKLCRTGVEYSYESTRIKRGTYALAPKPASSTTDDFTGLIFEFDTEDNSYIVTENDELYEKAKLKNKKKKEKKDNGLMTQPEVLALGSKLCNKVGFPLRESTPHGIIAGIVLCDQLRGVEATNEILGDFPQKWLNKKEENEKRFEEKYWLTKNELERLGKRLAEVKTQE